jgi:hypothetical protein
VVLFFGQVVSGMGRERASAHGVRVGFTACRVFEQPKIYVFMFCIMSCII